MAGMGGSMDGINNLEDMHQAGGSSRFRKTGFSRAIA